MNKIFLLSYLLFFLTITVEFEVDDNILGTFYDKSIMIIKGMSENYSCYNMLVDNKTVILPSIIDLIALIQKNNGSIPGLQDLWPIIVRLGGLAIELVNACNISYLSPFYTNLTKDEERIKIFEDFGFNIVQNVDLFYNGSSNFVKERGIDAKLALLGKIIRATTNFTFY